MGLIDVIRLGRGKKRPLLVEPMCPGDIGLLQVVVESLEFTVVDGIDAPVDRIIVPLRYPPHHEHARRVCRSVPRRNVITRVNAGHNRPMIIQFYVRIDARLRVAIEGEHQRVREQVVVGRQLGLDIWWRNVPSGPDDHSLGDMRNVQQGVSLNRIPPVQTVVLQKLAAEPPLRGSPAPVDSIKRRETKAPIYMVGLHGVRQPLNA